MSLRPLTRLVSRDVAVWQAAASCCLSPRRLSREPSKSRARNLSWQQSSGGRKERGDDDDDDDHHVPPQGKSFAVRVEDYDATVRLAELFACQELSAGDVVVLDGSVGAGKSSFVRELIRSLLKDDGLVVPSPTYLLQQSYDYETLDGHALVIDHFDLYRLAGMEDGAFDRLQMLERIPNGITFIEHANVLPDKFIESNLVSFKIKIDLDLSTQVQDVVLDADDIPRIFKFFASGEIWRNRLIQIQTVVEDNQLAGVTKI